MTSQVGLAQEQKKSWGNPIWGDVNNDGFLDLIVPDHGLSVSRGPFVYLNNGGTSFADIRATSGIKKSGIDTNDWHGFCLGDYDGDGNMDVYVAEGAKGKTGGAPKSDLLFKGNGDGTFTYVSPAAGIELGTNRGRCGYWFDYDNDGKLDLFVKNYAGTNCLYHNNGDGTFTDMAAASGLSKAVGAVCNGSIVGLADYDNDGYMDIVITGDGSVEALYRNFGNGTFQDVTSAAGLSPRANGKGVAWGDYDNDGYVDLFISRGALGAGSFSNTLYKNNGNGTFTDVSATCGIAVNANTWSGVWGDYDNDGYLDLFVSCPGAAGNGIGNANYLYHNNGDGTFTNVAAQEGVAMADGSSLHKTAAWADYNNDGFLDLLIKDGIGNERDSGAGSSGLHRLFKNNGNSNHSLKINLTGVQSNLHGIGARVTVTSGSGLCFRENDGGGGGQYASESVQPLHFGLGQATTATVTVNWPGGGVDTLSDVAVDSTLTIVEGSGRP